MVDLVVNLMCRPVGGVVVGSGDRTGGGPGGKTDGVPALLCMCC